MAIVTSWTAARSNRLVRRYIASPFGLARTATLVLVLALGTLIGACTDAPPAPGAQGPAHSSLHAVSVTSSAGAGAVTWLPPLGPATADPTTFDATAAP